MGHVQLHEPQLQPPAMAATVLNVQDRADMSVSKHLRVDDILQGSLLTTNSFLRNQIESPLLQLPPEVRNEICKLAMLATYEDALISYDTLGAIETEHRLPWTHVCKQLWTETRMLPFALCTFSFGTGRDYAAFVGAASAEQRDAVGCLKLELLCEGGEMGWGTEILDVVDDYDEDEGGGDVESETGPKVEKCFKSTFPNLQRLNVEIVCFDRRDAAFVKRWIADLKRSNKGVTLRIKKRVSW